ncbi:chromosomal replication initiator protein DnaA [Sphingomonas sp.]|uniref:chromosomal replication initiator protein DnaA n=1 Tax=Sphingomonas sp. TaxID=28214 RepID=UPI0025F50B35|nr:chromosomal replication initiator protein DnaA [Sphingomonas sp.]
MRSDGNLDSDKTDGSGPVVAAWDRVREGLRRDLGARSYDNWLARVRLGAYCPNDRSITLVLPSAFMANWVTSNLADRIQLAWRAIMPDVLSVRIVAEWDDRSQMDLVVAEPVASPPAAIPNGEREFRFDSRMTFDNFVVGDANRIACNAGRAIAEGGPMRFNPLFVYGPTGQGKTHLLHAIGHGYQARKPQARAIAMSAERFMVDFVNAMRNKDTMAFKERLRSVDLLMIDDFQFIAGKVTTQEEFLYTIDELMRGGRRLIITSDRSPHELDGIEGRILSRLTQGLVVDIHPADLTLRRAILGAKVASLPSVVIPPVVLDMLASRIASNVRELEGGLNRLVAYASLNGRDIDEAFAEDVLADMFRAGRKRVTIDEIQRRVSDHFNIRATEMVSARRARAVARPRQIAMYLSKQLTPRSLPEIGRRFGGRDHTTVIHAVKQIEKLRASDSEIDSDVRTLLRSLEG